ncbi:MAG: hypothetical protein P8N09_13190 [Planctomycetota bacterium]|nr:hypothetical protein [Planctomycetota bacterium]
MRVLISKFACASVLMGLLGGCAAPDWSGMSQADIAGWKTMDIGPGDAQHFNREGLHPTEVEAWHKAGFKDAKDISAWHVAGFDADKAASWKAHGFSTEDAKRWNAKEFTAENAQAWTKAGMSLSEAIKDRAKGLQPVKAVTEPTADESKKDSGKAPEGGK